MPEILLKPDELRPLVEEIVDAILAKVDHRKLLIDGKRAINEREAAALLGLNPWQIRDIRLAGKIGFTRIVGGRIRYTSEDVEAYLRKHHQPSTR